MEPDYKALYHSALKTLDVMAQAEANQSKTAAAQRELIIQLMREIGELRSKCDDKG